MGAAIERAVLDGGDKEARADMLLGSMMAGQAFANSPVAAVHALAYPIGGHFKVPHGLSNALVLPHVLRFNAVTAPQPYAEIAPFVFPEMANLGSQEAASAFAEGMARIRFREYRPAIAAFEKALIRQPDFPEAEINLEITRAILNYVEDAREASDTGEDSGIGADDVVFDNDDARGAQTQVEAAQEDSAPMTAEQWMSSIDTDMTDFLRSRFVLENEARKR